MKGTSGRLTYEPSLELGLLVERSRARGPIRRLLRDRAGLFSIAPVMVILLAVLLVPTMGLADPVAQDLTADLRPPGTPGHVLGTDQFGRDLLSRTLWGGRTSIVVGAAASVVAIGVGVPLGMVSGYVGGRIDSVIMRLTDVMLAFPYILLALFIVAVSGPGLLNALIAVAITNIPFYLRLMRGIVLTIVHQPYVEASVAMGATTGRTLRKTILPGLVPYVTVSFAINIGWLILEASGLSFLGLGAQPPVAEWGAMLAEARNYIVVAPHVAIIPGLAIFLLVVSLNAAGDALRDALDVEIKER